MLFDFCLFCSRCCHCHSKSYSIQITLNHTTPLIIITIAYSIIHYSCRWPTCLAYTLARLSTTTTLLRPAHRPLTATATRCPLVTRVCCCFYNNSNDNNRFHLFLLTSTDDETVRTPSFVDMARWKREQESQMQQLERALAHERLYFILVLKNILF